MKKRNFWAIFGVLTVSAAFWACSTPTLPAIPVSEDEEIAEISSDSQTEASSSESKPAEASSSSKTQESSSSDTQKEDSQSSSSAVESSSSQEPASSAQEPESSSSVEVSSSSEVVESSSSEHKVPEKATDKNTQAITKREDVMESPTESASEIEEMIESEELVKSDSLVFNEKDLNFETNDYYCYDAENEGWYKISGSKWKGFIAGLIDWWNKLINGERYFDYSKVCDEIYIKAKSK